MLTRARRCAYNNIGSEMGLLCGVIILELIIMISAQEGSNVVPKSPCPEIFNYEKSGGQIFGVIKLQPTGPVSSLEIKAIFTVAAELPSHYGGKLVPLDPEQGLERYNNGEAIKYHVHFSLTSPIPRLFSLVVNNRKLCDGPKDIPVPNKYVTTINIGHKSYSNGGNTQPTNHLLYTPIDPQFRLQPFFDQEQSLVVPKSPCPEIFKYRYNGDQLYGEIRLQPSSPVSSVVIKTNFSIATNLPSGYLGKLTPLDPEHGLQRYNNGEPLVYRVHFPVTTPAPRLFSLVVNDRKLCDGPKDIASPNSPVTTVYLGHRTYSSGGDTQLPPVHNSYSTTEQVLQVHTTEKSPRTPSDNPSVMERSRPKTEPSLPTNPPRSESESHFLRIECGVVAGGNERQPLIHHGQNYDRGDWPWLVAIYKRNFGILSFICAGTLITEKHVVTAAHCIQSKTSITSHEDLVVRIGVYDLENDWGDDQTVTRNIESITIHKSYNATILSNDITLITLKSIVAFSTNIRPACLWDGNPDLTRVVGASGVVAGWGSTELGPSRRGLPKMARIPVVSTSTCRASKPDFHKLTSETTLCAGDRNGVGPCLGDSGGGLYILDNGRWRLRGVVSLSLRPQSGEKTCDLNQYIVFTDAAKYISWIRKIIRSSQI